MTTIKAPQKDETYVGPLPGAEDGRLATYVKKDGGLVVRRTPEPEPVVPQRQDFKAAPDPATERIRVKLHGEARGHDVWNLKEDLNAAGFAAGVQDDEFRPQVWTVIASGEEGIVDELVERVSEFIILLGKYGGEFREVVPLFGSDKTRALLTERVAALTTSDDDE